MSVSQNLDELRKISSEASANRKLRKLVAEINDTLLMDVIDVLRPIDTATETLSCDTSPTLHLVAPTKLTLSRHLSVAATDSAITAQLKQHLSEQLNKYFPVNQLHYTATLLDPRLKSNTVVVPPQETIAAVASLKRLVDNTEGHSAGHMPTTSTQSPTKKKSKPADDFLDDIYEVASTAEIASDEVLIFFIKTLLNKIV